MSGDLGNIEITPPTPVEVPNAVPIIDVMPINSMPESPNASTPAETAKIESVRKEIQHETGDVNPEATERMFEDIRKKEEEQIKAMQAKDRSPLKRVANAMLDFIGVK